MPCTFNITDTGIQLSKGVLKFQARISQSKGPIAEGELLAVEVQLVDPTDKRLCGQKFNNVKVLNSILNLDFEPTDCAMDQVVAAVPDLQFKLIIGGHPVKTIPIGTVPYALKANHAVKAQKAHQADVAAQAHYAHRITADRETLMTNKIGTGYFDFYTPTEGGTLYPGAQYSPYVKDGFMQWTPVSSQSSALHVAAKDVGTERMAMLEAIYLESKSTVTHGGLVVDPRAPESPTVPDVALKVNSGGMRVNGGAYISGPLEVAEVLAPASALVCRGSAKVEGETETRSLTVNEAASVGGALTVTQGATVSGGLVVAAMANDAGASLTSGGDVKFSKALEVAGEETVKGYFTAKNGAGLAGPLVVSGTSRFDSMATLNGGLTASGPVRFSAVDGGAGQEVEFVSPAKFGGKVTMLAGARVQGQATFADGVTAERGLDVVGGEGNTSRLKVTAPAEFTGANTTFGVQGLVGSTVDFWANVKFHGSVESQAGTTQESWHKVASEWGVGWGGYDALMSSVQSGWVEMYESPGYMRDTLGFVHLRGVAGTSNVAISGAAHATTIFTLPEGYRPKRVYLYLAMGPKYLYRVSVRPDGAVVVDGQMCADASECVLDLVTISFDVR